MKTIAFFLLTVPALIHADECTDADFAPLAASVLVCSNASGTALTASSFNSSTSLSTIIMPLCQYSDCQTFLTELGALTCTELGQSLSGTASMCADSTNGTTPTATPSTDDSSDSTPTTTATADSTSGSYSGSTPTTTISTSGSSSGSSTTTTVAPATSGFVPAGISTIVVLALVAVTSFT